MASEAPLTFARSRISVSPREQNLREWKTKLNEVKSLYWEGRYKRCAALCESLLKDNIERPRRLAFSKVTALQLHPLHKTFLNFYAALSYESLGQVAHKYSSNKIPLLTHAREAFNRASACLPLPYASEESGRYSLPDASPTLADFATILGPNVETTSSDSDSRTVTPELEDGRSSSEASSEHSHNGDRIPSSRVPNFDLYSSRPDITELIGLHEELVTAETKIKGEVQVNDVKETGNLMPKPLFFKKNRDRLSQITRPHGHPRLRKTAMLLNPAPDTGTPKPSPSTPSMQDSLQAYISSRSLAKYNNSLVSFRIHVGAHIAFVEQLIDYAEKVQREHKLGQNKRLASFWSFKPVIGGGEGEEAKAAEKEERIKRLRARGWMVRKENYGWKGEGYYSELRRKAEAELKVKSGDWITDS